ncbi:hypothetical protein [Nocardia sp. NPDC058705]|uniref:hypothetical protein n=1 Tax=Nocardia sp. NPDC058705 TaxID=3346609 RepID=UPI00368B2CB7
MDRLANDLDLLGARISSRLDGGEIVGRVDRLGTMLEAWKETARAYADPRISVDGSDLHYLETPEPVPAPEAHR